MNISLNFKLVSFGCTDKMHNKSNINYILIAAKYFVFKCKCLKTIPLFQVFKQNLHNHIDIEKHIALDKDKLHIHELKWASFSID